MNFRFTLKLEITFIKCKCGQVECFQVEKSKKKREREREAKEKIHSKVYMYTGDVKPFDRRTVGHLLL